MPRGDGTGRNGAGPMTGRGMGYCAGYDVPGYMNGGGFGFGRGRLFGWGRGFGRGFGYGRGLRGGRFGYVPPVYDRYDESEEMEDLKAHAKALESELAAVKRRLDSLHASGKEGGEEV